MPTCAAHCLHSNAPHDMLLNWRARPGRPAGFCATGAWWILQENPKVVHGVIGERIASEGVAHDYHRVQSDYRRFSRLRYPPASNSSAFIQNTGCTPAAVPSEPNTIGTTIWVNLLTVRRSPSASPARFGGESL